MKPNTKSITSRKKDMSSSQNYYLEYPVRCFTCGGPIACYASIFETLTLEHGLSPEEVMGTPTVKDHLNLTRWCCRISLCNPVIVLYNMQNQLAVDGKSEPGVQITKQKIKKPTKLTKKSNLGAASVSFTPSTKLVEPEILGIPVINQGKQEKKFVDVGNGKKSEIAQGRTYLAR